MNILKIRSELIRGLKIYDLNLNVAYYARVSTDKDDQLNSLDNQANYFKEMIEENDSWYLVDEYIDEGISGTAVKNRESFLRMIEDAKQGKIDLILTKEISRFSRNTVEAIKYTEELLSYGAVVYFISDNLNTIYPDSEFRLAIMASLAQDEIRKLSERVKFGIKRRIRDGKLIGGNLTGYYRQNNKLIINQAEKPIIELIFNLYSTGKYSFVKIARILKAKGYLNSKGKEYSGTTLKNILTNPKYKGYYTANLTTVENYKTHKKIKNPQAEQIIYKDYDTCPPIISEELWTKANDLYQKQKRESRAHVLRSQKIINHSKYTNKLICKEHDVIFIRYAGSNRSSNPTWLCREYKINGITKCNTPIIKEKILDKFMINLIENELNKITNLKKMVNDDYKAIFKSLYLEKNKSIKEKKFNLENNKERLINLSVEGIISTGELKIRLEKLNKTINKLNEITPLIEPSKLDKINKVVNEVFNHQNLNLLIDIFIKKIIVSKIDNSRYKLNFEIEFNNQKESKIFEYIN